MSLGFDVACCMVIIVLHCLSGDFISGSCSIAFCIDISCISLRSFIIIFLHVLSNKILQEVANLSSPPVKTGPSVADAAMSRIAQGTKVIAEGGYEKIFRQTFETLPDELLKKSYACYLSTSAGPVMGILYLSTAKLAFCSDNPLSYKVEDKTEWSYYKVPIYIFSFMFFFCIHATHDFS